MKIEVKLTAPQLAYIAMRSHAFCEDNRPKFGILTRKEKAALTIAQDVADKLHTKARTLNRGKPKKDHKVTFKYHEALSVNYFAFHDKDNKTDDFIRSLAQNIHSQLDPLL